MKRLIVGLIEKLGISNPTSEKYKIFRNEVYKDWIISIYRDSEKDIFKWTASPRYWIGLGYSNSLIKMTKLKEKTRPHRNMKEKLEIENIKKTIDKFEQTYKNELEKLKTEFEIIKIKNPLNTTK